MRGHDFMWITEMENRNAHDVLKLTITERIKLLIQLFNEDLYLHLLILLATGNVLVSY